MVHSESWTNTFALPVNHFLGAIVGFTGINCVEFNFVLKFKLFQRDEQVGFPRQDRFPATPISELVIALCRNEDYLQYSQQRYCFPFLLCALMIMLKSEAKT